jgi:hypothetical protein
VAVINTERVPPPLNDPGEIAAALRDTVLSGLPIEEDVGGAYVVTDIDIDRILPSWRAARALVDVTGRWPVMIGPEEIYGDPSPDELADLRQAATGEDPWAVFHRDDHDEPAYLSSVIGDDLAELAETMDEAAVGRWVYDRMLDDPALARRAVGLLGDYTGTGQWYTPPEVHLALLPTTSPWLAPGWLRYHGAGDPARWRALAGALHEWQHRWGAELVAWYSTMLEFVVERPPPAGDAAWEVAGQLRAVGGSLQMDRWMLALGVARSDAWFLHDRP